MSARRFFSALLILSFLPTGASAGVRPWLALHGGGSTYAMRDLNDELSSLNELLGTNGLHIDEIHGAFGFGASAGIDLDRGLRAGVGYERLPGSTSVGDATGSLAYDVSADMYRGFVEYAVMGEQGLGTIVGFSAGRVIEAGSIRSDVTGVGSQESDLEGSGPAFEFYVGGEYRTGPALSFTGTAGYRHARASNIEVRGVRVYNASGDAYSLDYTGLFARLALKLTLARSRDQARGPAAVRRLTHRPGWSGGDEAPGPGEHSRSGARARSGAAGPLAAGTRHRLHFAPFRK